MIPENFPLAENIGPGHVPRHGSVTGTATERQQPLPCRLQAPAGNAAVFPGQAPRFGEPFFLAMCRSVRTRQTAHGEGAPGKRPPELPVRAAGKGLCRCAGHDGCRSSPVAREKTGVRRGRGRIAVPRLMTARRQGPGGDSSGASPVGAVCYGNGTGTAGAVPSGPAIRLQQDGCGGKTAPPAGKEAPCCRRGLPFAGFWSMEARSSKHTPAAARGARQCATAHFSLSSGHGAGAAAGRVAGSGPVWKITTLLED